LISDLEIFMSLLEIFDWSAVDIYSVSLRYFIGVLEIFVCVLEIFIRCWSYFMDILEIFICVLDIIDRCRGDI